MFRFSQPSSGSYYMWFAKVISINTININKPTHHVTYCECPNTVLLCTVHYTHTQTHTHTSIRISPFNHDIIYVILIVLTIQILNDSSLLQTE
jgi:hypothetical protein